MRLYFFLFFLMLPMVCGVNQSDFCLNLGLNVSYTDEYLLCEEYWSEYQSDDVFYNDSELRRMFHDLNDSVAELKSLETQMEAISEDFSDLDDYVMDLNKSIQKLFKSVLEVSDNYTEELHLKDMEILDMKYRSEMDKFKLNFVENSTADEIISVLLPVVDSRISDIEGKAVAESRRYTEDALEEEIFSLEQRLAKRDNENVPVLSPLWVIIPTLGLVILGLIFKEPIKSALKRSQAIEPETDNLSDVMKELMLVKDKVSNMREAKHGDRSGDGEHKDSKESVEVNR